MVKTSSDITGSILFIRDDLVGKRLPSAKKDFDVLCR